MARISETEVSSFERGEPGTVHLNWDTQKTLERLDRAVVVGLNRALQRAEAYWREVEWTQERHPDMTGEERDKGVFEHAAKEGHVTRIRIGSTAAHALFEEYGTVHRRGHAPIRKTIDVAAPMIRPAIRYALRGGYRGQ